MPKHIGYVVDGNRRWAKLNGVKADVHARGAEVVFDVARRTVAAGVPFATFYVFSTENWGRENDEVNYIMKLFVSFFKRKMKELLAEDVKVVFLGGRDRLSGDVLEMMEETETKTSGGARGTVSFCLNYGGRQEIADAVNKALLTKHKNFANIDPTTAGTAEFAGAKITTEDISANLYHPEIPDVDMVVRTGGELRLSNFMLWRVAYSELLFLDKLWPDLTDEDVDGVIAEYGRRQRRFGK